MSDGLVFWFAVVSVVILSSVSLILFIRKNRKR